MDHMAELLQATRKWQNISKDNKLYPSDNSNCHLNTNHYNTPHSDKHKLKSCNNNEVNEVINQTCSSNSTPSEPKNRKELCDSDSSDSILDSSTDSEWWSWADKTIEVKLSNIKYATNFPVTINKNKTISLFDTGTTISCMSKTCFDKLDPKPTVIPIHMYKANVTNGSSFSFLGKNICPYQSWPQKKWFNCQKMTHSVRSYYNTCTVTQMKTTSQMPWASYPKKW